MAIDLTDPKAKAGAEAALQILIKSKYGPIVVTPGQGGGGGPQLTPPRNVQYKNEKGEDIPNPNEDENKPNQGQETDVKVTKTNGQNQNQPQAGQKDNSKDGQGGGGSSEDDEGQDQPDSQDGGGSGKDTEAEGEKTGEDAKGEDKGKGKNSFDDPDKNAETMKGIKADSEYKKEKEAQEKEDAWNKMMANQRAADFSELESDLYYAIAAQVGESNDMDDTYEHGEDPVYADSEFMMPQQHFEERRTKPLIYVFFDQSGSFGEDLINRGKSVLKVLDDFIEDGKIMPPKLFVFGNRVHEYTGGQVSGLGGGTGAWPQCMQIIKEARELPIDERCTNVMVLSDSDIMSQTDWHHNYDPSSHRGWREHISVEGCVFWCWAYDDRGTTCEEYLKGERGNFRYKF